MASLPTCSAATARSGVRSRSSSRSPSCRRCCFGEPEAARGPPGRASPTLASESRCALRLVLADGLEVVHGCVVRDVRSELPALHVGGAVVEARPDSGLDQL